MTGASFRSGNAVASCAPKASVSWDEVDRKVGGLTD
jgi:hypothetical protein